MGLVMSHATETAIIRRELQDNPIEDTLGAAVSSTSATNWTVTTGSLWIPGQIWESAEVSSTGAEQILVYTAPISNVFTSGDIKRAHHGSTATTHANGSVFYLSPRFTADQICTAIDKVLAVDLYEQDVFEIVEHQITSSATTNVYNAPSTSCEEFLEVYQVPNTGDRPIYLRNFTRRLQNVDTTLYSNAKYAQIEENHGVPGTALYYVNCKHRLSITTITARQSEALRAKVCAYLLAQKDIPRTAGPTNQGDRSVKVGDQTRLSASYWENEYQRLVRQEAYELRQQFQPERRYIRRRRYRTV